MTVVGTARRAALLGALGVCAAAPLARASDPPSVTLGLRLQGWFVAAREAAPDGGTSRDFFLRRGYLSVTGRLSSSVSGFVHVAGDRIGQAGLDAPGLGLGSGVALRDAWIAWAPHAAFRVQAGRMYVPFMRAFGTGGTFALLGADLPATQGGGRGAIFYPSKVGRDDGVVLWGTPARGRVQYRLGVMEGVEGSANPGDAPRLCGRFALQLLQPEDTWFNKGTYLGEKRVFALGVGIDRQTDLQLGTDGPRTYRALTADLFFDHPLGRAALTVEGSWTDAESLPQGLLFAAVPAGGSARLGYLQAGVLLPWRLGTGRLQLYGRAERVWVTGVDDTDVPAVGVHYLVRGQDLKLSADWSRIVRGDEPAKGALTLQAQLGF